MIRSRTVWPSLFASGALLTAACSWDRFDELRENAPVEELPTPDALRQGFGSTVTTMVQGDRAMVLVSGTPGASSGARYELGVEENPVLEALETSFCERGEERRRCFLGEHPAALRRAWSPSATRDLCYVVGIGRSASNGEGLWTRCLDATEYVYKVPRDVEGDLLTPLRTDKKPPATYFAADRSREPYLVVGAPDSQRVWYYEPAQGRARDLVPPGEPGRDYGRAIAVARFGGAALVAASAPADGSLWLYRVEGATVEALGCLGGDAGFGRALTTGDVDGDGSLDLVVSHDERVHVFSGAVLFDLPATDSATCSLASLPEGGLITSLACGSGPDTSGCSGSDFGAALATADLDGDGKAEIAVGAPAISVRGLPRVGAVLVYDGSGELRDTALLGSAGEDSFLGSSLDSLAQGERDVLVIGAPGKQRAAIFYCLLSSGEGPRCSTSE